ncbi:hypothetical protein WMF37_11285 [Sorangium sp. So ce291]|uniref:hypothetical protein n=1 Tax=Sorangium sp. So ce291 TaxID=3133294 RepID=UPI003F60AC8B
MNQIEIVEKTLGESLAPDLIYAIERSFPRRRLVELHHSYKEFTTAFRLPPKKNAELRPFINHAASEGLGLNALYLDPRFSPTSTRADSLIKHHLLYAHSVVLHDPLPYHLDFFEDEGAHHSDVNARKRLANYLAFLMNLRPLIEANVLLFADDHPYKLPWLERNRHWPPYKHLVASKFAGRTAASLRDLEGMLTTLVASELHEGQLDIYVEDVASLQHFAGAITLAPDQLRPHPQEIHVLDRLLKTDVPSISDLSLGDVVSIRKSEEAFDRWRRAMGRAISRIESFGGENLFDDARRVIHEEARGELAAAGADVRKVATIAKDQVKAFTITSLAALAVSEWHDPTSAIARAGMAGLLSAFWQFMRRGMSGAATSYTRHVALFEDAG